jgi:hypothetical protein
MFRCAAAWLLGAALAAAATYDVGPGQPLTAIGDAPWATLQPGDVVNIHWRPQPYREKWVICRQGTPAAPITVRGIPGPGGEKPVIDGGGATTAPGLNYWSEVRGIIKIGGANTPPDLMPRWIVVEGLDIRGARASATFTDDGGATQSYQSNASAIYLEKGENIVVRDCDMHDCGNGFFVASSPAEVSRDVLVAGNHIWDNGNAGSAFEHNSYTAAVGITFERNRYGPLAAGAIGNALKDRSAGLVVRWNWIEGGNRQLDLVDAEDSALIVGDPSYGETRVYGNVLIERDADGNRQMVHYGGDSGTVADYRKGVLRFYNNTLVSLRTDRTTLFRLSTNEETCDARNNIAWAAAAAGSTVSLIDVSGVLDWQRNLIAPGWRLSFGTFGGTFNDAGTSIEPASPGFVDLVGQDYRLAPGSPALDAAMALDAGAMPLHDLARQYVKHVADEPRPRDAALDVGAYELGSCAVPLPGLVTGLRFAARDTFAWDPTPDAETWDVARLVLPIPPSGLQASIDSCFAPGTRLTQLSGADAPGSWAYVVRARNCAGAGSWDSGSASQLASRDPALAGACP